MFSVTPQHTLALCLLAMFVVIGVWDVAMIARGTPDDTVSSIIGEWAEHFPMLAIAVGVLVGHLFWPRGPRP